MLRIRSRIWIRRIRLFLGLLDPDPDPLVRVMEQEPDPAPVPSIIKLKIVRKPLIPTVLLLFHDFLSLKKDVNVPSKSNKQKNFFLISFLLAFSRSMTKIRGSESGSGSISQRHGSADPDPHKNVMDPQHWLLVVTAG